MTDSIHRHINLLYQTEKRRGGGMFLGVQQFMCKGGGDGKFMVVLLRIRRGGIK